MKRGALADRRWVRLGVRAFAILLAVSGVYFIWANYWWSFEWVPTFAAFDGEPVPSTAERWKDFLPYAAIGTGGVAIAVWIFLATRKPLRRSRGNGSELTGHVTWGSR